MASTSPARRWPFLNPAADPFDDGQCFAQPRPVTCPGTHAAWAARADAGMVVGHFGITASLGLRRVPRQHGDTVEAEQHAPRPPGLSPGAPHRRWRRTAPGRFGSGSLVVEPQPTVTVASLGSERWQSAVFDHVQRTGDRIRPGDVTGHCLDRAAGYDDQRVGRKLHPDRKRDERPDDHRGFGCGGRGRDSSGQPQLSGSPVTGSTRPPLSLDRPVPSAGGGGQRDADWSVLHGSDQRDLWWHRCDHHGCERHHDHCHHAGASGPVRATPPRPHPLGRMLTPIATTTTSALPIRRTGAFVASELLGCDRDVGPDGQLHFGVAEVKLTVRPDVAVATKATDSLATKLRSAGSVKLMVWLSR